MDNTISQEIGQKIRTARRAKDLSQQQVAELTGMKKAYYSRIERGEVSASIDKYIKILKALGLKFDDIIAL